MRQIIYTDAARNDLRGIYEYIAYSLLAPQTAANKVKKIISAINNLSLNAVTHKLYEHEPWHSKGLRVFPVDKYLVFYIEDKDSGTIQIVRIMYGGRDIKNQL